MDKNKSLPILLFLLSLTCACERDSFEKREDRADVVLTGTVRHIKGDDYNAALDVAEVEVKRTMKGKLIIQNQPLIGNFHSRRKRVWVHGLGTPKICHSAVRKGDTRIFMLKLDDNGKLVLDSSIVRMTLSNIRKAETAVSNVPFQKDRPYFEQVDPCRRHYCGFGSVCQVNERSKKPECICQHTTCKEGYKVCGSDGETYGSMCHLQLASCLLQKAIAVTEHGECRKRDPCLNKPCNFGAKCVPSVDGSSARCLCPQKCYNFGDSVNSKPVCGTDGRDYRNLCELQKQSCEIFQDIKVKYYGKCDPCKGHKCGPSQTCQLGPDRRPECKCQGIGLCPSQYSPVCGSDGRTYSNECIMKVEACKWRQDTRVVFRGECGKASASAREAKENPDRSVNIQTDQSGLNPCEKVICGAWEECRIDRQGEPRCECPLPCEQVVRPVCGNDDRTYDNECEMKRTACQEKRLITVNYRGPCEKDGPCSVYKCDFGATCVVKDDEPACECPQCVDNIDPVCGSDGISYSNECKLRLENCLKKTNIQIKHRGQCDGCAELQCDYNSICQSREGGEARCVCPTSCVQIPGLENIDMKKTDAKVCGTDGVTYLNECELKVASCRNHHFIMVASYGQCDRCADVQCRNGARCEKGRCVCPQVCPADFSPVCGSDGETYSSQCVMMRSACLRDLNLKVVHHGNCKSPPKVDIQGSGMPESGYEICDESTCRFGGVCDQDSEGDYGCICNFYCQDEASNPVCGSDGKLYKSVCHMREASCTKQSDIAALPLSSCQGIDQPCDGKDPLADPITGLDYDCASRSVCPAGSYCHKGLTYAKCCIERMSLYEPIRTCKDTLYGCCPDGKTASPGPFNSGCPSMCQCNALGSYGTTCDPINLQCECRPGVGGKQCNRCNPGWWGMTKIAKGEPGCSSCNCNAYGSVREDCEQMTGRCICKPGIKGTKCNICADGSQLGQDGCASDKVGPKNCDEKFCNLGSTCQMKDGKPTCVCQLCPRETNDQQMVCGTDGQTYGSECQLRHLACKTMRDISVQHDGSCRERYRTDSTPRPYSRSRITTRHIDPNRKRTTRPRTLTMPTIDTPTLSKYDKNGKRKNRNKRKKGNNERERKENQERKKNREKQSDRSVDRAPETKLDADFYYNRGKIDDICLNNGDCLAENSWCSFGICLCKSGLKPTSDKRLCYDTAIIVPQFSGQSYMKLSRVPLANRDLTIDIDFRTLNKDGLILYTGGFNRSRDFLSLTVNDGFVEFRFDLGSGPVVIKSKEKVEMRKFHHVQIHRTGKNGILKLDHEEVVGSSAGVSRALNLNEPIYLGFVPDSMAAILKELDINVGLVGCIQMLKVTIDDIIKSYNLVYPESADVTSAFEIAECGNNPCNSLPCQNGGICLTQDETNYKCVCEPGYKGESCSIPVDPCKAGRCAQGSTCRNLPDGKYECQCAVGQKGEHCDEIDFRFHNEFVPEFTGKSYIEYRYHDNAYTRINFELWFLTTDENGVLLYNGQAKDTTGDYLSLNLRGGYLEFRFNLGSGSAYIRSSGKITLNRWHKVYIDRDKQNGIMVVNDEEKVQGRSKMSDNVRPTIQGLLQSLNMDQVIYVGGVKDPFLVNPDSGVREGLKGAIQRLYINKRYIENLAQDAAALEGILPFNGPPCDQNPCLNGGVCQPVLNQVKCKCTVKYGGSFCESDLKEMTRQRSIRPIQFDGRTHLQYNNDIRAKVYSQRRNKYQITFITSADNGILLVQHASNDVSGDYLSLAIIGGRIEFSFNLGKQKSLFRLKAPQLVNDGRWHTVVATRDQQRGSLQVDNYDGVAAVTSADTTQLDTDGHMWIGGKRHLPRGLPLRYYNGFVGCISEFWVDGRIINMVSSRKNRVSIVFCDK